MGNRNAMYFVVGLVVAGLIGAGIWAYRDSQRDSVEISVGRGGVSIERN